MIELLIAVVTVVGAIIVEFIRRSNRKTDELKQQIVLLTQKVDELQDEVVEWQSKYLLLLHQLTKEVET